MRKKDPRTKCIKRKLTKCKEVFRAYDDVQNAYADKLENDPDVVEFECNVPFDDEEFKDYATDFVIIYESTPEPLQGRFDRFQQRRGSPESETILFLTVISLHAGS